MLLAAMLAMALAAAAPVFAQDGGNVGIVNQQADQFGVVDDSVCSQVFNIAVQQYNAGDQTANADAFADAEATAGPFGTAVAAAIADADAVNIANAAGIDVDTVNACLNNFTTVAGQVQYKKTVTPTAKTVHAKKTAHAKKTVTPKATVHAKKTVTATSTSSATSGGGTLPETGGASLLALGAGALLVVGGLVARRIAR